MTRKFIIKNAQVYYYKFLFCNYKIKIYNNKISEDYYSLILCPYYEN
ncbi:hypothetical protein HMPREF9144_0804 [Prevotella pallens ATCC 700821]|uniref:Uncharacterized protein n=2 Tax=Prevotella pallens TaxID=60133 RepID=F9DGL4_9BACT|nr:hypothetical protein HMPREF9144_0804 [Prevotella pallens ATCC 700821]RAS44750.1 hypothetical protein BC673_11563 [Prevotella pallens]